MYSWLTPEAVGSEVNNASKEAEGMTIEFRWVDVTVGHRSAAFNVQALSGRYSGYAEPASGPLGLLSIGMIGALHQVKA